MPVHPDKPRKDEEQNVPETEPREEEEKEKE